MVHASSRKTIPEAFNIQKVVTAVNKDANRVLYTFTDDELKSICDHVEGYIRDHAMTDVQIWQMHNIVESARSRPCAPRSRKATATTATTSRISSACWTASIKEPVHHVHRRPQKIQYGFRALVSTKRSLIFNQLNKELYQKFFMNTEELQACRDGYIYIHDMSARRDTMNCCLFDVKRVPEGRL